MARLFFILTTVCMTLSAQAASVTAQNDYVELELDNFIASGSQTDSDLNLSALAIFEQIGAMDMAGASLKVADKTKSLISQDEDETPIIALADISEGPAFLDIELQGSNQSGLFLQTKKVMKISPEHEFSVSAKVFGVQTADEITLEADYYFNNKVGVGATVYETQYYQRPSRGADGLIARVHYFLADYFSLKLSYSDTEVTPFADPVVKGKTWLFGGSLEF